MKEVKSAGDGSVTRLRNGRFWVRGPLQPDGRRPGLGTYATEDEANTVLETALFMADKQGRSASPEFVLFGREVLDLREKDGYRGVDKERDRFEFHLAESPIAHLALSSLQPSNVADLARWLSRKDAADKRGKRKIGSSTIQRVLSIGSIVCQEAVLRGFIPSNPFTGVTVKKRAREATADVWTFLSLDEQRRLATCEKIPYEDRIMMRCALGAGIREGEQIHNYLTDLHLDVAEPFLFVRYGGRRAGVDLPPKNGKTRKVPLFGDALVAFREWVEIRKTYLRKSSRHEVRKDEGLIFPTVTGCRRTTGKFLGNGKYEPGHPRATDNGWVDLLARYYELAGVPDRPGLHWHCLRHSCATSLLEGFWGPAWAIEEVSQMLGHSSIAVTQRYAHPSGVRLRAAAARSQAAGYALVTGGGPTPSSMCAITSDIEGSHLRGLNSRPTVYEGTPTPSPSLRLVSKDPPNSPPRNQLSTVAALASSFLDLVRQGQGSAALAVGVSLATAALEAEASTVVVSSTG